MLAPDIDLDAVKHLYAIDPTVTALAHCKSSGGTALPELDQLDPDMATRRVSHHDHVRPPEGLAREPGSHAGEEG